MSNQLNTLPPPLTEDDLKNKDLAEVSKLFADRTTLVENYVDGQKGVNYIAHAGVTEIYLGVDEETGFLKARLEITWFTKNSKEEYTEHKFIIGGNTILNAIIDKGSKTIRQVPSQAAIFFVTEMCKVFKTDWDSIILKTCVVHVQDGNPINISYDGCSPLVFADLRARIEELSALNV